MATERIHIPIDRAGRVVLPKPLRERLGVHPGTEFEVIEEPDRIILKPVPREARIVNQGGWLVAETGPISEDINDLVERVREERDKHVRGL